MKHQSPNPVHPRLRGELRMRTTSKTFHNGSSPLTRGTLSLRYSQSRHLAVHPRLRGELGMAAKIAAATAGSSPLTRGTHSANWRWKLYRRFIPAYAGNSKAPICGFFLAPVHPRLRGELWILFFFFVPTRRFIPAYAGNSLKDGINPSIHTLGI